MGEAILEVLRMQPTGRPETSGPIFVSIVLKGWLAWFSPATTPEVGGGGRLA